MMTQAQEKQLAEEKSANDKWIAVLDFLVAELLGPECLAFLMDYQPKFSRVIKDDEVIFDIELAPYEKKLWAMIEGLGDYINHRAYRMPYGDVNEYRRIVEAFRELFWSEIKLHYHELQAPQAIGIRDKYRVVSVPHRGGDPMVDVLGPFEIKPR